MIYNDKLAIFIERRRTMNTAKSFQHFLADDPSLSEKFTYEDFINRKSAAPNNDDIDVQTAYNIYRQKIAESETIQ